MKILALESSAIAASAALCEDGKLLGEFTLQNGNTHSETLLPLAESILRAFSLSPDQIDLFAVSAGPGSFTGVRIGCATVKGLAFGTGKPCIGVSTLEALAENLTLRDGLICPVMNARRGQVYTALFRCKDRTLTRLLPDSAMAIGELDALLGKYGDEPISLVGDGYDITVCALTHPVRPTPERLRPQSAYSVAQVAKRMYDSGIRTDDAELVSVYLRPSQAERERLERENAAKQ